MVKLKEQLKPSPGQSKKQIGDESTQFIDVVADLIFNEVIETKISSHFQSAQMTVPRSNLVKLAAVLFLLAPILLAFVKYKGKLSTFLFHFSVLK